MAASSSTREKLVQLARLSDKVELYEEMVRYMEKVVEAVNDDELTREERHLLNAAYKKVIDPHRATLSIIASKGDDDGKTTQERRKIESELSKICEGALKLLDTRLIPASTNGDSKVYYLKMKGDHHRYLSEIKTGEEWREAVLHTLTAYKTAQVFANSELPPVHPYRLGLALNFSVVYYDTLQSKDRAYNLVKQAFDEALPELDALSEEAYKESSVLMHLLHDKIAKWASVIQDERNEEMKATAGKLIGDMQRFCDSLDTFKI